MTAAFVRQFKHVVDTTLADESVDKCHERMALWQSLYTVAIIDLHYPDVLTIDLSCCPW